MESAINTQSLLAIGIGIVLAVLIFKVIKSVLRAVGLVILVAIALYFWQGGTMQGLTEKSKGIKETAVNTTLTAYLKVNKVPISELKNTFCADNAEDLAKCSCVVEPIYQDLIGRLSQDELAQLEQNKELKLREIRNSINNQMASIRNCSTSKGGDQFKSTVQWLMKVVENNMQ